MLEEPRIRLLDAFVVGVEDDVERARQPEPIEGAMQRAVGVGKHDQAAAAGAQRGQGRQHLIRDRLPQIVRLMIRMQIGERARRSRR